MARLLLMLMLLAAIVMVALVLFSAWNSLVAAAERQMRPAQAEGRNGEMAPTGIQKAAYVALIVVLFGVASGWLGGL